MRRKRPRRLSTSGSASSCSSCSVTLAHISSWNILLTPTRGICLRWSSWRRWRVSTLLWQISACMGYCLGDQVEMNKLLPDNKFISNSWCVLNDLSTRCDQGHVHQRLIGGRGAAAAIYPVKLCRAICRGIANQKRYDAAHRVCSGAMSDQPGRCMC